MTASSAFTGGRPTSRLAGHALMVARARGRYAGIPLRRRRR